MDELTKKIIFILLLIILSLITYFILKNYKKIKKKYRNNLLLLNITLLLVTLVLGIINFTKNNEIPKDNENTTKEIETTTNETPKTSETTTETTTTTTTTTTTKVQTTTKVETTTSANLANNKTRKGYTIEYRNGAYYINNVLVVNKTYKLTKDWKPVNPYKTVPSDGFDRNPLDTEAYEAWKVMKSDAASLGLNLWAQSGYRSYDYQNDLYQGYIKRSGQKAADTYSARPGASEHQTGLAFDLNTITNSFKNTAEGKWVNNNCYLYGYIIRYPEGKTNETGYIYEPWHIRYVGKELAKELYNNGNWITMEDYFGIDSKYND